MHAWGVSPLRPLGNPPNPWASTDVEYLDGQAPLAELQVYEDRTRGILAHNDSPDVGFSWSVNPYRGCFHACAYCYARPSHEYLSFGAGTDFERKIVVKPEAAALLREAFDAPRWRLPNTLQNLNMITTNFLTLPVVMSTLAPETKHPGDAGSFEQCSEMMGTIASAVALINETEAMHESNLRENADWLCHVVEDSRPMNVSVGGQLPASLQGKVDPARLLRFKNRETILIGSYVVNARALLGVLAKEYEHTADFLRELAPDQAPTKDAVKKVIEERNDELRHVKRVRDKVYAHTAFADPRREDHLGVELTSLLMFTGEDYGIDKNGVTLGISHVYLSGKVAAHFYSGVAPIFPEVSVASLAKDLAEHLPKWHTMFERLLETIATVPPATVCAAKPNVRGIHVYRGAAAVRWNSRSV